MSDLLQALGIDGGIVCAVGAGGKKTTLYRIAEAWEGSYALTATVFTTPPPRRLWDRRILETGGDLRRAVAAAGDVRRLAYAAPSDKPGRVGGVPADMIATLHREARRELTLVKADGARMRGIKAPREGEPVIPPGTDVVLHIVSAGVLGQPLDERAAHRLEELSAITGLAPGEPIEAAHLARLIASPQGACRGVDGARLVSVINQVDDEAHLTEARRAARAALEASDLERVVLTAMRAERPVVEIVRHDRARQTDAGA